MSAMMMRSHTLGVLSTIGLTALAIAARAAGLREIVIPADHENPAITANLWTPCGSPPGTVVVSRGDFRWEISGVKDCTPSTKRLPLIVFSHGMLEDRLSHYDTAAFLADAGFAVVTLDHPKDSASAAKADVESISSFLDRPGDISRAISFLSGRSHAFVDIDPLRIGFFGFSRGGYTGLVLAGAVPDFRSLPFPCPDEFLMCRQIRDNDIPPHEDGYDSRIKAFVIADPVSFFPDKGSLQKVQAPIQLWSSEQGGMGVRPEDVASVKDGLPNHPEFRRPAHSAHFAFQFPCSAEMAQAMSFVCTDPAGFDRAAFHEEFNAQVLKFLRETLGTRGSR